MRTLRPFRPWGIGWLLAAAACSSLAAGDPAAPAGSTATVALEAVRDATLVESDDGSLASGRGPTLFVGRTAQAAGSRRRALVAFDVAAALPAGARVESATLTLTLDHTHAGETRIALHRLLAPWGEGPSATSGGRGAPAEAGDATWLHASFPDRRWSRPGGDFADAPSAAASAAADTTWSFGPTPEMARDVEAWRRDPASNFGWLLLGEEDGPPTAKRFASREDESTAARPRLVVTYR